MLNNKMSHDELMDRINEVSFAVNDMQLYLDTHPHDQKALDDFRMLMEKRNALLEEHCKYFGPLTVNCASEGCNDAWAWILQPWPWENKKGRC